MLSHWKVGSKVVGAFLLIAAISALVGLFAVMKIREIDQKYSAGWDDNSKSLQYVDGMSTHFQMMRVAARDVVLASTDAERQSSAKNLEVSAEECNKAIAA